MSSTYYLKQLSDGRWYGQVHLGYHPETGKRQRYSTTGKRKEEVLLKLKDRERRHAQNRISGRMTLEAYFEQWMGGGAQRTLAPGTLENHRRGWADLRPHLGHLDLDAITPRHIDLALQSLSKRPVHAQVQAWKTLRRVLRQAFKERLIEWNPCAGVDGLQEPAKRVTPQDVFSADQAAAFVAQLDSEPLGLVFSLALLSGLRPGELLALDWQDIDWEGSALRVSKASSGRLKTSKSHRRVLLPSVALDALRNHTQAKEGPIFPGVTKIQISRAMKRICKQAGLPHRPFRALRNSHATLLLEQGESLKAIQERLGHAGLNVLTSRYAAYTETIQQSAAAKLDALFRKN